MIVASDVAPNGEILYRGGVVSFAPYIFLLLILLLIANTKFFKKFFSMVFDFLSSKVSVSIIAYAILLVLFIRVFDIRNNAIETNSYGFDEQIKIIETLLKIGTLFVAFLTFSHSFPKDNSAKENKNKC